MKTEIVKAKVLVSACLIGREVRYDGTGKPMPGTLLDVWRDEGRLVPVCPEVAGGLGVPRPPAELVGGDGADVLEGNATVQTEAGRDVTNAFVKGARAARRLVEQHGIAVAVLKERSPSCGHARVYDGTFSGELINGFGVTAAMLAAAGVEVFGESELEDANRRLQELDASD